MRLSDPSARRAPLSRLRARLHALHVLAGMLVAFVAAALLSAVSAASRERTAFAGFAIGLDAAVRSLDPQRTTAANDFRVIASLYEGLVRFRPGSLEIAPSLAERWSIDPDGLTYRFTLRPGARFHDGTPCDAAAVRASFLRMRDPREGAAFPLAFFFERIARIETPDARTVVMVLDQPFAPLLANLAHPAGFVVSAQAAARAGKQFGRQPVGSGPFRLARWDAEGRITLTRAFGHAPTGRAQTLLFRPIEDAMTRSAELRAGQLDLVPELPADNVAWFRRAPGFRVHEAPGPHLWFVILDVKKPPLDDVRVRRALNYAVDKRAIARHLLADTATPAAGPIAAAFFPHASADDPSPYPHDPARARALLAEAGYAAGLPLTLHAPQTGSGMLAPLELATAIQADLARVGVQLTVVTHEWNSYLDLVNRGLGPGMELAEMAWMTHDPDTLPFLALRSDAAPPHGFNSGRYASAEVDALLARARRTHVDAERRALYRAVQQRVHDDAPWLFVVSAKQTIVTSDQIAGLALDASFQLHLADVALHVEQR